MYCTAEQAQQAREWEALLTRGTTMTMMRIRMRMMMNEEEDDSSETETEDDSFDSSTDTPPLPHQKVSSGGRPCCSLPIVPKILPSL
mmetsp:Transcript_42859/g.47692  ORF Transcript_42859/g.47692 Transcript_42859/m.47692 type:complete len:87 (-) Transcript_42859:6-266(-)